MFLRAPFSQNTSGNCFCHQKQVEPFFFISLNVFIRRIARSTCIQTVAIYWFSFTCTFVSWYLSDRNYEMFNSIFKVLRSSVIVNPLSTIHELPSLQNWRSNIPLLTIRYGTIMKLTDKGQMGRCPPALYMWCGVYKMNTN